MSDIALAGGIGSSDIAIVENDIAIDNGLDTAIKVSLGSDRRANDGDVLPDGHTDRRGWWGDAFSPVEGDRIGSRLWLLSREKQQTPVLARAEDYAREALAWLLEDKVASRVDVVAEFTRPGMLGIQVTVWAPAGDVVVYRYDNIWAAMRQQLSAISAFVSSQVQGDIDVALTINQVLQNAATVGAGAKVDVNGSARLFNLWVIGVGPITGGEVTLERAHDPNYPGAWLPVGTPLTVVEGIQVKEFSGLFRGLRAPITAPVTGGGNVTVILMGLD